MQKRQENIDAARRGDAELVERPSTEQKQSSVGAAAALGDNSAGERLMRRFGGGTTGTGRPMTLGTPTGRLG